MNSRKGVQMNRYKPKHLLDGKSRGDNRYVFDNENAAMSRFEKAKDFYLWVQTVIESIIAAFVLLTFVFNISVVVGSSMEPTLQETDRLVVLSFGYTPRYGDVVALWADNLPNKETGKRGEMIVKRIIGLPGDIIGIDSDSGVVYRNGKALREDYIKEYINASNLGNAEYPLTVDENCVFVLGDNRNHSTDSRYVDDGETEYFVGCIDMRCILGKAVFRIYPFERIGVIE